MAVEVIVYEEDNTTVAANLTEARQVRDVSGKDLLLGVGTGEVTVDHDHPQVGVLTGGRIVQVHDSGRVPLSFSIDKKREVFVPGSANDADKTVTVSGKGLRGYLDRARVLPWLPVASDGVADQRPITRRRLFNPASPTQDLTAWTTPIVQARTETQPARPRGWPSNDAKWLWGITESDDMAAGDCWFVRDFTLEIDSTCVFLVTADDKFVDFLEGAELQREEPKYPTQTSWDPFRSPMQLKAGTYRYSVKGTNETNVPLFEMAKAAIMAEGWRTSSAGMTTRIFMSGLPVEGEEEYDAQYGTWKCLSYPEIGDAGYGHTPGEIMDVLLTEAQARSEIPDLTWDFTGTLDSNGDAWADRIPEIDFDATGTVGDAISKLEDSGYCDVEVTNTGGLELRLFNKGARGTIQPITISAAAGNLKSHAVETNYDIQNNVLLVRDRGMYLMDSDLSTLAYGPRPGGSVQVGPIETPEVLENIGAAYLDGLTNAGESVIIETTPLFDVAASPGDYCDVEGDLLRVTEMGFKLDQHDGGLRTAPVFSTPYELSRKRSEQVVQRLIAENGKSQATARVIDTGTNIPSGKLDPVKLTSWSWTLPEDLEVEFWDTDEEEPVGWQPYTLEESVRIWAMIVECDWAEPDGLGGITQVSEGQSRFSLQIDGGPAPVPLIATVPETSGTADPYIYGIQYIFGPAYLAAGQRISVAPIENGAHVNGSVSIWATEPL